MSVELTGVVGGGAVGPFSWIFLRLRGERSACFLSVLVGDLAPELQRVKGEKEMCYIALPPTRFHVLDILLNGALKISISHLNQINIQQFPQRTAAFNTYMPAGRADGETVCSWSGV